MSGLGVRDRRTSAQLQQRLALGDLGTLGQFRKHHSGHKQGTPFPAPDLGPNKNNHSATKSHTCPLQAGTCSTPAPLSMVPAPHWG